MVMPRLAVKPRIIAGRMSKLHIERSMEMNKGLISVWVVTLLLLLPTLGWPEGQIYKVVDKDGNVTFTDQRPSGDAEPMDLPPLSVIESDLPPPSTSAAGADDAETDAPPTPRELRRQFRDFSITQPLQEETFWGTENTVVVAWGSSNEIPPELSVMLYVDGEGQKASGQGSVTLTLDRGEHQVYAELRDQRNRRIVTSPTVTFFIKQHSANFRRPGIGMRNGTP